MKGIVAQATDNTNVTKSQIEVALSTAIWELREVLFYVKPQSIQGDMVTLLQLSNENKTGQQLGSKAGHLFQTFERTALDLPDDNDTSFLKRVFCASSSDEKRYKTLS